MSSGRGVRWLPLLLLALQLVVSWRDNNQLECSSSALFRAARWHENINKHQAIASLDKRQEGAEEAVEEAEEGEGGRREGEEGEEEGAADQQNRDDDQDDQWAPARKAPDDLRGSAPLATTVTTLPEETIPLIDIGAPAWPPSKETNPLIANNNNDHHDADDDGQQDGAARGGRLIEPPASSVECPSECAPGRGQFCAADGRVYESLCAIRRRACQLGAEASLYRVKSLAFCRLAASMRRHQVPDEGRPSARCSRADYLQFKEGLWQEFNGNLALMFEHLDANADSAIEARELWPRPCPLGQVDCFNRAHDNHQPDRFPFDQAHFSWSGCSLSHLMLFELERLGDKFNWTTFKRSFRRQLEAAPSKVEAHASVQPQRPRRLEIAVSRRVELPLAHSVELNCASKELERELLNEPAVAFDCSWWRHGVNLASSRDERVRLIQTSDAAAVAADEPRAPATSNASQPAGAKLTGATKLRLEHVQLYLSGPFECACHSARSTFIHKFQVQVIAKAHVSVRPQLERSLVNSRVAFECQYDFVDTANGSWPDGPTGLRLAWFRVDASGREWPLVAPEVAEAAGDRQHCVTCSQRASISMDASRLMLEQLQLNDTGEYRCRVAAAASSTASIFGVSSAQLIVQDGPSAASGSDDGAALARRRRSHRLWLFHEAGISIFQLDEDEGQELGLVHELTGHHPISGQVDGNWNQLTLCGGLNQEQAVICEWSDNALELRLPVDGAGADASREAASSQRSYIYVAQPNLNRLLVLDGRSFAILAIVNTEPQPRKLFAYKPNKIHLNKWVRRRLSPTGNARWLQATAAAAHPLELTPKSSRLYSDKRHQLDPSQPAHRRPAAQRARRTPGSPPPPPPLVQRDIWLLCYGQPLVVDPTAGEPQEEAGEPLELAAGYGSSTNWSPAPPHSWRHASESQLRNRKSIQIIQSTFFAQKLRHFEGEPSARHTHTSRYQDATGQQEESRELRSLNEFKRSTVLTSHFVVTSHFDQDSSPARRPARASLDLVQDLAVPQQPAWLAADQTESPKLPYAYATHYAERRLYRIAMDSYHYDRWLDLSDCDPARLLPTVQGQLVVQCRAPITRRPLGQLVLDELTQAKLQFNANIKAQDSYLSPDSRYLVSVQTDQSAGQANITSGGGGAKQATIIYVQLVGVGGLALQYEIKTSLEIVQCSFVWRHGYYAAVLVAINRRDQQSELLSLRLADSRLELMVRVPGLISTSSWGRRHEPLNVLAELKLASLSTSEATYIVDLDENRIVQTLRQNHQSNPTLLWT